MVIRERIQCLTFIILIYIGSFNPPKQLLNLLLVSRSHAKKLNLSAIAIYTAKKYKINIENMNNTFYLLQISYAKYHLTGRDSIENQNSLDKKITSASHEIKKAEFKIKLRFFMPLVNRHAGPRLLVFFHCSFFTKIDMPAKSFLQQMWCMTSSFTRAIIIVQKLFFIIRMYTVLNNYFRSLTRG